MLSPVTFILSSIAQISKPPPPQIGQLGPLFFGRQSKTMFCAYDRKVPMKIMMVEMIIMMVTILFGVFKSVEVSE